LYSVKIYRIKEGKASVPNVHFHVHGPEMKEIAQPLEHARPLVLEYKDDISEPYAATITSVEKSVHLNRPQFRCIDNNLGGSYDVSTVRMLVLLCGVLNEKAMPVSDITFCYLGPKVLLCLAWLRAAVK
jgi:hypothetical protein